MQESRDQYESVCRNEFGELHTKLDKLDESIRGNGRPGIQVRLDRLEQDAKRQGRLVWLIIGVMVTLAVTALWRHWMGG